MTDTSPSPRPSDPASRRPPTRRGTGRSTTGDRGDRSDAIGPGLRRQAALALGLGAGSFLLFHLAAAAPGVVETLYGRAVGPAVAWALARVTAPFPFPVAQALFVGYVGWLLVRAVRGLRAALGGRGPGTSTAGSDDGSGPRGSAGERADRPRTAPGGAEDGRVRGSAGGAAGDPGPDDGSAADDGSKLRAVGRALGHGAMRLGRDAGVLVVTFYLLWGFHYARPSLEERLGLPAGDDAGRDELVRLAERSVAATNRAYRAIHGSDDAGTPTAAPDDEHMRETLAEGWRRLAAERGLPDHLGWRYGPPKAFVPDGLLVRFGLGGFYFPWTGEAVVDGGTPASDLVQSIAHEQAHQRGVGPEDEASFVGFLAASRAPDPVARYSALLFAQRHLVSAAASGGPPGLREQLTADRLPGVTRDLQDLYAYLLRRIDPAARVTRRVNDAYLKSNRVEGGVASYGLVTRLLVAASREDGEDLFGAGRDGAPAPQRSQPAQSGGSSPK